jgi:hypothetical protein
MLKIIRTQSTGSAITTFLDASVSIRDDNNNNIDGYPDIVFSIKTYEKIAKANIENVGDMILLPINLFFDKLTLDEHKLIYEMYKFARVKIDILTKENRREIQDQIHDIVYDTVEKINLPAKMIEFCLDGPFVYPDLSNVGKKPHHSEEKTFLENDYAELTAISVMSKLMVPIWGEFVRALDVLGFGSNQREKLAFDLIEDSLEDGAMSRIYSKLSNYLSSLITDNRKAIDKKPMGNAQTSFILTHNGIDDQLFESITMATIVMKRLATYESLSKTKDGGTPNAMVYIDDGIKKTADTKIKTLRKEMNTMPRRELPSYDTEDNTSVLDHASKTSKKPIDVPVFVAVAAKEWEIPRLLRDTKTPMDVFTKAVNFYTTNTFEVSPITQALVASFVGTRFGGSKCLNYLPMSTYQQIVVILQIFLIKHGMIDLASLVSSRTSKEPIDVGVSGISSRIKANLKSAEYHRCASLFRGYLDKPTNMFGRKPGRKPEITRIDFTNHIERMSEWLIHYSHKENMAPVLWDHAKIDDRPTYGTECKYDENTMKNLCSFYLSMHDQTKPF